MALSKNRTDPVVTAKLPVQIPLMGVWYIHLSKTIHASLNIPPRNSLEWDKEYDRRTSVERSNKREKEDYKLEDGRHRSSMMWYCRLYYTMMLQHLDAWEMPSIVAFQSLLSLDA
ncbi:MAG: hypothetical protein ACLS22_09810 [Blautia wexlerae]